MMIPKPIRITMMLMVTITLSMFYSCSNKQQTSKADLVKFLNEFSRQIKASNTNSVMGFFEGKQKMATIDRLIKILNGKAGVDENTEVTFKVNADFANPQITAISDELSSAVVTVYFKATGVSNHKTSITLKVHQLQNRQFKIAELNITNFLRDYTSYVSVVEQWQYKDKDIYDPITLKAFEIAGSLKPKYDSVAYFAHIDHKTYFYVGKIQPHDDGVDYHSINLKMGLLNPQLKVIIPQQYDQIYSINGTFKGLVEVEAGTKRGFYNLDGRLVVPVEYDEIFPLNDPDNLAVLRKDDDYYYFKNDSTISDKTNLKAADFISKIKLYGESYLITKASSEGVMEANSKEDHFAVYFCPSYLADLNMVRNSRMQYANPLRKHVQFYYADIDYNAHFLKRDKATNSNWVEAAFYYIKDHFLGDRSEMYYAQQMVVADQKSNRVLGIQMGVDYTYMQMGDQGLTGMCNESGIKMLNDTLYEVKTSAMLDMALYNNTRIGDGAFYHYIVIRAGKLVELPDRRKFNFTRYVKMDESYLNGCYGLGKKALSHVNDEMLRYMKNEIYASYKYHFKDPKWIEIFNTDETGGLEVGLNANVNDSLTAIDKYNIDWINKRLKAKTPNVLAANE